MDGAIPNKIRKKIRPSSIYRQLKPRMTLYILNPKEIRYEFGRKNIW